MALTNLPQMVENVLGPEFVRKGASADFLVVTAGYIEKDSADGLEPRMVALLLALRQQHKCIYLILDPGFDEDLEEQLRKSCKEVYDGLFLLPHEQSIESWYAKLGRGNWLLMFSCQPMLEKVQLSEFEPVAENLGRLLNNTGAQI